METSFTKSPVSARLTGKSRKSYVTTICAGPIDLADVDSADGVSFAEKLRSFLNFGNWRETDQFEGIIVRQEWPLLQPLLEKGIWEMHWSPKKTQMALNVMREWIKGKEAELRKEAVLEEPLKENTDMLLKRAFDKEKKKEDQELAKEESFEHKLDNKVWPV